MPNAGFVDDWTHHHLVFSNPGTREDAVKNGKLEMWEKITNNPRYQLQQAKRAFGTRPVMAEPDPGFGPGNRGVNAPPQSFNSSGVKKDWSEPLGSTTATVQPNVFPAKYGASITTANCANVAPPTLPDFVVYPTGHAGSGTVANIIAFDNLYSGCSGYAGLPQTYWAYNTENGLVGYAVATSPIISLDGTKIAFIQSNGTVSYLVVVKWKASNGTFGSPVAPTIATNITTCTAPCMTVTKLSHNDTYSAPFYDYESDDALYVGDDSGYLEKFTGVFNGAVTAVTPVGLSTHALAPPVYEVNSGCVFVGDTEGVLYSVSSGAAGTVCTGTAFALHGHSVNLGEGAANEGIFDAPLVDPVAQTVYAFVAASGTVSLSTTLNIL